MHCLQWKVSYHTVCVQTFVGLYFMLIFCESTGICENENVKIGTHMVQVCSCRPPFVKLKSQKLLGVGRL